MRYLKKRMVLVVSIILLCILIMPKSIFADSVDVDSDTIKNESNTCQITIKLPEKKTTGCLWYYNINDEKIAKVVSQGYSVNSHIQGIVGTGGVHSWIIKAINPGTTDIVFKLYRPLNSEVVYDTKKYKITVSEDYKITVIGDSFYDETTDKYITNSNNINETIERNEKSYIQSLIGKFPDILITQDCYDESQLNLNQTAVIKLPEKPNSGFSWHYYIDNIDALQPNADETDLKINNSVLDNSLIYHYWAFTAKQQGKSIITFKLYKDSEGEESAVRIYKFIVNVTSQE